jgi:hypothetical protein
MLRTRAPTHEAALEGSVIFGNVFKIYDRPADVVRVLYDVQTQGEAGMPGLDPERDPNKKGDDEKKSMRRSSRSEREKSNAANSRNKRSNTRRN